MGYESKATVRIDGRVHTGVASIEADRLTFRGDADLDVTFAEIASVEVQGDWLELRGPRGLLLFEVGANAAPWAERIANPRIVAEKLGLERGRKVAVLGKLPAALREDLAALGAAVPKAVRGAGFGAVVLVHEPKTVDADVARALALQADDGFLWVLTTPALEKDRALLTAGRTRGLTDARPVRVAGYAALRFVLTPAARAARRQP